MKKKRIGFRNYDNEPEDNNSLKIPPKDDKVYVENADLDFVIKKAAVFSRRADAMTLAAIREEKRKIEELRKRLFGI